MQAGERIGPYVVESRLGSGQMGIVYAVRRPDLDARYAVKVLRRELCAARDLLRFQREIELLAAVSKHPHVVPIHSAGEDRCGLYYVMDLVEGPTLEDLLARGGAMPAPRAARYVRDIADALTALHRAGIVHRDIKPSNVLVDARDSVRLADFGLARTFADDKGRLTNTGELVGTPHFMSPEQALGFPVGPAADVYAVGMVLFTLLAGRPAVEGKGLLEVLTRVGSGELVPLPKLAPDTPEALFSIISRCLRHEAAARPPAAEVVEALESFLRAPPTQRIAPRRSRAVIGLTAVASLSLVGAASALAVARRARAVVDPVAGVTPVASVTQSPVVTATPKTRAPLTRLDRGSVEELREVLARVDALTGASDMSDEERAHLVRALQRLDGSWVDPGRGAVFLAPEQNAPVANELERLVLIHALLRRLEPAHTFPAERRVFVRSHLLGPLRLGPHAARLGPRFLAEVVALAPEDVDLHKVYCDSRQDVFRHADVVDLGILRRGVALARRQPEYQLAAEQMMHSLATYLWKKVCTNEEPGAIIELEAIVADAEASASSGEDVIAAMCLLNQVLIHVGRFDDALALALRARKRSPTAPEPWARSAVTRLSPTADDGSLEEAQAEAAEYFRLTKLASRQDEHLTRLLVTRVCGALEAEGDATAAEALCARALAVHPDQGLPVIACRRVLLLCRLEAAAPTLAQALAETASRLRVALLPAAADGAQALSDGVAAGTISHADVAKRLPAACGPFQEQFELQPPR